MNASTSDGPSAADGLDSSYAWRRLGVALVLASIGSVGMWSFVVALPAVQADFGIARGEASLPFTMTMFGFGVGGIVLGRLADRSGILLPIIVGSMSLGAGYFASSLAEYPWQFALAQGVIGFGSSATFGPLMTDISHWFTRRRGIAVAIVSAGNYLGGTIWPPIVQHYIAADGWRVTHVAIGVFCVVSTFALVSVMRRRAPEYPAPASGPRAKVVLASLGISPNALMVLLCIAGVACCVAMSMPQVHIVAYCGDLGYGPARGAEMLSLMLGLGIVSRIASGVVADRIGGVATLLLGSALQGAALFLYLLFDGLVSLYVISGLFGLFQGGIVPMYAIIIRNHFSPRETGVRLGVVLMATLGGMALGGWLSGLIFDVTGSYRAAFINGLAWNLVNVSIMLWLLMRPRRWVVPA